MISKEYIIFHTLLRYLRHFLLLLNLQKKMKLYQVARQVYSPNCLLLAVFFHFCTYGDVSILEPHHSLKITICDILLFIYSPLLMIILSLLREV